MKRLNIVIAMLVFIGMAINTSAQKQLNAKLAKQIDSLKEEDQRPAKMHEKAAAEFQRAIHSNFPVVKSILDKYGFPGYSLVGKESSHNYWLLVQHSDFDLEFQKRALKLMKTQVDKQNATGQDYAYLIDRIEINENRPQVYGTQVNMGPGGTKIKPCIDTANLDNRRKLVGMQPIKDYLKQCDEAYKELNKGN